MKAILNMLKLENEKFDAKLHDLNAQVAEAKRELPALTAELHKMRLNNILNNAEPSNAESKLSAKITKLQNLVDNNTEAIALLERYRAESLAQLIREHESEFKTYTEDARRYYKTEILASVNKARLEFEKALYTAYVFKHDTNQLAHDFYKIAAIGIPEKYQRMYDYHHNVIAEQTARADGVECTEGTQKFIYMYGNMSKELARYINEESPDQ